MSALDSSSSKASTAEQRDLLALTWNRISALPATASDDEIDDWLGAATERECPYCHRQHLQRWEVLNRRCTSCLEKLLAVVEDPEEKARRLELSGIPPKYRHMTLATWRGGMGPELEGFKHKPRGQVLIFGGTEVGKTHAATALLRFFLDSGVSVFWTDAGEAVRRLLTIRDGWWEDRMRDAAVLVIDEFGRQSDGGVIERIVRHRDLANRGTILTSNLGRGIDGRHAIEVMSPSLWTRLTEVEF